MTNLSHKDCQELKDAGFPQNTREFYVIQSSGGEPNIMVVDIPRGYTNLLAAGYELVACPTFSELIEACGKRVGFELLEEFSEKGINYKAVVKYPELEMARGKTPKEAVAKLYIALHDKE